MRQQTEMTVRMLLKSDASVTEEDIEKAVNILKGKDGGDATEELQHVIRRKDVLKLLGVHRRTLDYYVEQGYLKRVYGIGKRALGISRDSFLKFTAQRAAGSLGAAGTEKAEGARR